MIIETFDDLYDAILYLEVEAEFLHEYFKGELLRLEDGRWRCGIITEKQLELPFGE